MTRFIAIILAGAWVLVMLAVSGGQMRESDQASLLAGAVELARGDAPLAGNDSYNYDKQYLSYWVVAAVLKVTGAVGEESSLGRLIVVGNRAAAVLFSLALLLAACLKREWTWPGVLVLAAVLLSPVVAFTVPLLSPNVFCGTFTLLLLACLARGGEDGQTGAGQAGLLFFLALAATAARQDVILIMPLVALLVVGDRPLSGLFRHAAVWAMAAGCVVAMGLGMVLAESRTPLPEPFFVAPVFAVYLAGGLGASLLLVLAFAGGQAAQKNVGGLLLGGAMLLPLVFYGVLLYTPRHLFLVSLALLATLFLPYGTSFWKRLGAHRMGPWILGVLVLGTVVPWLCGIRLTERTKGALVVREATLYPTADGFWPLGAYGSFLVRLAAAEDEPLDHNQELWAAWAAVDPVDLPEGRPALLSSGLASYGNLFLAWYGRGGEQSWRSADHVLLDDRTLSKRQVLVDMKDHRGQEKALDLLTQGRVRVLAREEGRAILLWHLQGEGKIVDEAISLRLALAEAYGGNDFRLERAEQADWKGRDWRSHRMFLAARGEQPLAAEMRHLPKRPAIERIGTPYDEESWMAARITSEDLQLLLDKGGLQGEAVWISCGMLPDFMDVGGYGK